MRVWMFAACALATAAVAGSASAATVNIAAGPTGYGCTSCYGGPPALGSAPGNIVTLVNEGHDAPLTLTLGPGTYSITNGATTGTYSGWRFNGSDNWVWNWVIGADLGNNQSQVLKVGSVAGVFGTQAGIAGATGVATYSFGNVLDPNGSTAGYYDTLTLTQATTLDFFVIDGYLPDNAGGVSLTLTLLGQNGVPEPATWALMILGFGVVGDGMRGRRDRTAIA